MNAIARDRSEVQATITKGWLLVANRRQLLDCQVEGVAGVKGARFAPERLADELIAVPTPVQSLLRAVIDARYSLQCQQQGDCQNDLAVERIGAVGCGGTEPLFHVVVV